jgi:hypothetical protein
MSGSFYQTGGFNVKAKMVKTRLGEREKERGKETVQALNRDERDERR